MAWYTRTLCYKTYRWMTSVKKEQLILVHWWKSPHIDIKKTNWKVVYISYISYKGRQLWIGDWYRFRLNLPYRVADHCVLSLTCRIDFCQDTCKTHIRSRFCFKRLFFFSYISVVVTLHLILLFEVKILFEIGNIYRDVLYCGVPILRNLVYVC